jgi:hypothetical protein
LQEKIGRRGLGFRSVYNITDVPQILSGETLLQQDPRFFLQNHDDPDWGTQRKGGITFAPYTMLLQEEDGKYRGHLLPFSAPPYNVPTVAKWTKSGGKKKKKTPYCKGTFIRAALRLADHVSPAGHSVISRKLWTLEELQDLLVNKIGDEYRSYFIFLRVMEKMVMHNIAAIAGKNTNDSPNVEQLLKVEATRERVAITNEGGGKSNISSEDSADENLEKFEVSRVTLVQQRNGAVLEEQFDLVKCGGGSVAALANDENGCVTGTFYAGLPIRNLETGCGLHVNAFFHPDSERQTLILNEDETTKETKENLEFLERAAAAARKLIEMRTARDGAVPLQFFPNPKSLNPNTQKPKRKFAECFYRPQEIAKYPKMHCDLSGNVLSSLGFLMTANNSCPPALRDALKFLGAPVVTLTEDIIGCYMNCFDGYDIHDAAPVSAPNAAGVASSASHVLNLARPRTSASAPGPAALLTGKQTGDASVTRVFDGKLPVVLNPSNLVKWMRQEKQLAFEQSRNELLDEPTIKSRLQHCLSLLEFFATDPAFEFKELEGLVLCPTLAGNVVRFSTDSQIAFANSAEEKELAGYLRNSNRILNLKADATRLACFTTRLTTEVIADALKSGNSEDALPTPQCAQAVFRWLASPCKPDDLHHLDGIRLWRVHDSSL